MKILDIKRFDQIEEVIGTIHKAFPHLPRTVRRIVTELVPYVSFCAAAAVCIIILIPLIIPDLTFGLFNISALFPFNVLLLRAVCLLLAYILFISFTPLSRWMKKGWYNLFYASLIQLLLTLMFFNVSTLLAQIMVWYVLFEVKKDYS